MKMTKSEQNFHFPLEPVIPDIRDWPIYQLTTDKERFLQEVQGITLQEILKQGPDKQSLNKLIEKVLYQEKLRLTQNPWKADDPKEKFFWSQMKNDLIYAMSEEGQYEDSLRIVDKILVQYSQEIFGNFKISTYKLSKKLVPFFFRRILNASGLRFKSNKRLEEKIRINGEIESVRNLAKKGTLIFVPTHFSNLDSPVIGFAIDAIGLPASLYGAGLNLFTIKVLSWFMSNLGAYKVDRRKKNFFYLEMLKNYSCIAIQRGAHSLFFPGGTRSRSGSLEKSLKLGLLGTAVEAQRVILQHYPEEKAKKIFIVPCVISYHFVLEAPALIREHLKATGKEKFLLENDEYSTSYKLLKTIIKYLTQKESGMYITVGKPMDVVGNEVDAEGISYDHLGRKTNLSDYFKLGAQVTADEQREKEYTRMLEQAIIKKYASYHTVLSSQLVAFTAFEILKKRNKELDIFALLRLESEETIVQGPELFSAIERLVIKLKEMADLGQLRLSEEIHWPTADMVRHGLYNLGLTQALSPLYSDKNGNYNTQDLPVLYYYHNRIDGYGLEQYV